jgi:SCY1-like protein 2
LISGILKLAATHRKLGVTKELIATRVLPFLFPLTIENGLTLQQFKTVMSFIHELIQQVESEQSKKLEEVGAIAREQM